MTAARSGWLRRLGARIAARPGAVFGLILILCLGAGLLAATRLGFATGRGELIDAELPWNRRYAELKEEFGDLNAIVITLRSEDREATFAAGLALEQRLLAAPELFETVFLRIRARDFGDKALLAAPEARFEAAIAPLERALPTLREAPALPALLDLAAAEVEAALARGGAEEGGAELSGALEALVGGFAKACAGEAPSAGIDALWPAPRSDGGVWIGDGETLLMLATVTSRSKGVRALREALGRLQEEHPGLEAGLTGKPVLNVDEMATYTRDSLRATLISLGLVTLLLIWALRRWLAPLLVGLCLILSIALCLGVAALWPGHLNLLSAVFVVIIIGLGVDFGLHLITRYDEEAAALGASGEALGAAMQETGAATLTGGATTAVAFGATLLTDFKGLRELGVIAGVGVLAALLIMLTALPALILLLDRRRPRAAPETSRLGAWWGRQVARRPIFILASGAALALAGACAAPRIAFDGNLIALQDPSLPSVQLELRLLEDPRASAWFLAVFSHDAEALRALDAELAALPSVLRTERLETVLPPVEAQRQRLPRLAALARDLGPRINGPPPALTRQGLATAAGSLLAALERAQEAAFRGREEAAVARIEGWLEALDAGLAALEEGLPGEAVAWAGRLEDGVLERLRGLAPLCEPGGVIGLEDVPAALRRRFIGRTGARLLRITPRASVWDVEAMAAFIEEVQGVAPEVTGVPLAVQESSRLMVEGYERAGLIALVVITLFLALSFRSLIDVGLCLGTLAVAAGWLIGWLALMGVTLNPANLIALPLLLGIGVDYALHVVHRWREAPVAPEGLLGTSLTRAIVASALTSAAGFGSLVTADHQGTASIGATIAPGLIGCLIAATTVLPAALELRRRARS